MNLEIKFVDELPPVNNTTDFLLLKNSKNDIASLWYEFLQKIIILSVTQKDCFKTISNALKENMQLHELKRSHARDLLGIGDKLSVIDIIHSDGESKLVPLVNFRELAKIYTNPNEEIFKQMMMDRFFVFLYNKSILLYPIVNKTKNYSRPSDWSLFVQNTEVLDFINRRYDIKETSNIKTFQLNAIISVLCSTTWKKVEDIKDKDITVLEDIFKNAEKETKGKLAYTSSILTELRLALIDVGRADISKPKAIIRNEKDYSKKRKFNFIDTVTYPHLEYLKDKAIGYYDILVNDGLAASTIQGEQTAVVNFFHYLMKYYPDSKIDIKVVEEIFEPNNPVNLYEILSTKQSSAQATLNKIVKFLVYCDLFSMKAKKNIPKRKSKVSRSPYRSAMPKDMIVHILDIIKNRPPLLKTTWDRNKADISWWKFEVYPIYPLMMLFGYYIPVRGEQVRNLCRAKSFIIKEDILQTLVINTDKNVNRKELQEIPCVWDDLQIFVPFLKWHKEYYKNIPLVKYHNDVNSPWEDIEPLFNTPQYLEPIAQKTHYAYHKKLLCQYQLEIIEKAKSEKKDIYPVIAWAKKGKKFFESVLELNRCSIKRLDDIEIMYDLHSLRVTGATRYLESGLGIKVVMMLTGHTTPDTLLRVYVNLTLDEKKDKLKSAIKNIYFGEPKELLESTADLISGELVDAYEKGGDRLSDALKQNHLFSLERQLPEGSTFTKYTPGIEIATRNHPSTWSPLVHGLCPAVTCPDGREHKCSLCPYLITGRFFANGIASKANQALAKFQRDSLQKEEEEKKGYKNSALANSLELQLEEILGWWEIIEKIDKKPSTKGKSDGGKNTQIINKNEASIFATDTYETELTYLANAYDAKMIGVEQDILGLKILTIKAIKVANANKDNKAISLLAQDENSAIDYLMSHYTNKQISSNGFKKFIDYVKNTKSITK